MVKNRFKISTDARGCKTMKNQEEDRLICFRDGPEVKDVLTSPEI